MPTQTRGESADHPTPPMPSHVAGLISIHDAAAARAGNAIHAYEAALALKVQERDWPGVAALAVELASYEGARTAHTEAMGNAEGFAAGMGVTVRRIDIDSDDPDSIVTRLADAVLDAIPRSAKPRKPAKAKRRR